MDTYTDMVEKQEEFDNQKKSHLKMLRGFTDKYAKLYETQPKPKGVFRKYCPYCRSRLLSYSVKYSYVFPESFSVMRDRVKILKCPQCDYGRVWATAAPWV